MTRRLLRAALAAATLALALAATHASAQTASASFTVSATVAKNCTIAAAPVNFAAYEPIGANDTAPLTGTGAITVRCTRGTAWSIALGNGNNFSGGRRMQIGATGEYLSYELYSDAARTTVWNATAPVAGVAANRAPLGVPVYVTVPGGQDAVEGTYTDQVSATVNF